MYHPRGLKGVEVDRIREKDLSDGSTRFYAEVQLKGFPRLTATFSRKSDAKLWIQKTESELCCERNQLIAESRKHTLSSENRLDAPINSLVVKKLDITFRKYHLNIINIERLNAKIIKIIENSLLPSKNL